MPTQQPLTDVQRAIINVANRDIIPSFPEAEAEVNGILERGFKGSLSDDQVLGELIALRNRLRAPASLPALPIPTRAPLALRAPFVPGPGPVGALVVLPAGVDPANVLTVTQRFPVGRSVGFVAGGRTFVPVIQL